MTKGKNRQHLRRKMRASLKQVMGETPSGASSKLIKVGYGSGVSRKHINESRSDREDAIRNPE